MRKIILTTVIITAIALSGCANMKRYDAEGKLIDTTESFGMLRVMTVKRSYYPGKDGVRGTLKEEVFSTDSTTKDVLLGLNELIDTAVESASKLKP